MGAEPSFTSRYVSAVLIMVYIGGGAASLAKTFDPSNSVKFPDNAGGAIGRIIATVVWPVPVAFVLVSKALGETP